MILDIIQYNIYLQNVNNVSVSLIFIFCILQQQSQRPDLARLMQLHASATGGLPPGPVGAAAAAAAALPPGLLPGAPGGSPGGLPTSIALLAGIPTSLAQAGGPHPAFASLLAQQKPSLDPTSLRSKDEELKRAIGAVSSADTNGSKYHLIWDTVVLEGDSM